MVYDLYERLNDLLADERFSRNFRCKVIRHYRWHGILTMKESVNLMHKYHLK